MFLLPAVVVVCHLSLKAREPHKSTQIAFESYYLCLVPTVKHQKREEEGGQKDEEVGEQDAKTKAYRADPKILKHSQGLAKVYALSYGTLFLFVALVVSSFRCSFLSCAVLF